MHESIAPLAALLGTWRGTGHGEFPTIQPFDFTDEWTFAEHGKPFVHFVERTWDADGAAKHTETGYLRCPGAGRIEIVAAIPTGQAECGVGTIAAADRLTIALDATVQNTPTAKHVERIVRRFSVHGDELTYEMSMAAVGIGLTGHLRSTLRRVAEAPPIS